MAILTDNEIRAHQDALDAKRDQEFYANIPPGYAEAKTEHEKWGGKPFTRRDWTSMSFADQSYYVRRGRRTPGEWIPDEASLVKMAKALSLTPSPSIISGYKVWAYDLLDWLDREGWKLVQK